MEQLLDFIFGNIVIIGVVLVGLYNLVSGLFKNEDKPMPSFGGKTTADSTSAERNMQQKAKQVAKSQVERYEEVKRQKEAFAEERYEHTAAPAGPNSEHNALPDRHIERYIQKVQRDVKKLDTKPKVHHFNKHISKQKFIDSIVMAEVLGKPRAHKPYQSMIKEKAYRKHEM
ncbi:hypothetical protein [Pontibacillus litoralis]|uniref:Uncharacterized protein n=1 Tax=Pontibacillus litoralis JSM 072002 TaxID=1385512 RepID=A0A0A5I007_9BACI|nr:hypothetical protein [Pontibacillus litoralis]KGX89192.1 hypothetical protein N784_00850 [Pontibacillus litoralis JSM 072002]